MEIVTNDSVKEAGNKTVVEQQLSKAIVSQVSAANEQVNSIEPTITVG